MNPTEDVVEQAIHELDNPQGEENAELETASDAPVENSEEVEESQDTSQEEEQSEDTAEEANEEVEEYSADEIEVEEPEEVAQTEQQVQQGLTPEQSYIFDNLPDINVTGKDGKLYTVKVPSQLPEDFDFANKREEVIFNQNVAAQELNARTLQNEFRSQEQSKQGAAFQEAVNASIRADVAELQNDGLFPKFKTSIDSPNFEKDPAAIQMQEVLDLMEERNAAYLEQAQKGGTYRFIGFKEAYDIYEAQQARQARQTAVKNEDTARKTIAKKESNSASMNEATVPKATVKAGTTTRDILTMIDNLDW